MFFSRTLHANVAAPQTRNEFSWFIGTQFNFVVYRRCLEDDFDFFFADTNCMKSNAATKRSAHQMQIYVAHPLSLFVAAPIHFAYCWCGMCASTASNITHHLSPVYILFRVWSAMCVLSTQPQYTRAKHLCIVHTTSCWRWRVYRQIA